MQDRTYGASPATALHALLNLPSLASQLLTAAADHLTAHDPGDDLTVRGWGRALGVADARVLSGYPPAVAQNAGMRAMAALSPEVWAQAHTQGEWALILRAAATTV